MESLKFKEKLGNQVLLISVISLIVTVVLILSTTIFMIKDYNDGILMSRANIGTNVLEKMISDKSELCRKVYQAESDNLKTLRLMFFGNVEDLDSWYQEKYGEEKGMFFLAVDPDGNTIYASPEYTFKSFDNARFTQEEIDGIVKCDNKLLVIYNKPVAINGKNYGMVFGYNLENESLLEETKEKTVCDVTLFRDNMRMMSTLIDPETGDRIIGTPMGEDIAKIVLENQEPYSGKTEIIGNSYYVSYVPMYDYQKKLCGAYFAGSDATEANGKFTTVVIIAIVLSVAAVVIVTLLTKILISKNVIKPIEAVSAIAREMAQGRLKDTEVEYQFAKSEIGNFAKDLSTTRTVISQYIEDISRILKAMGEGDFTNETSVEYIGDFKSIQSSMEEIVSNISGIIQNIDYSSGGVKSGAAQIADGSQMLAQGTTEQADAIEKINVRVSDIRQQVSNTATSADSANQYSQDCLDAVEKQNSQMTAMSQAMNEIKEKSSRIGNIIKTIEDIAFQTNILALNASVEAARAGEAGRGFAVVADEVRNLAAKSAEAAKTTTALITDTVGAVENGVSLAKDAVESMHAVRERTKQTSDIIDSISKDAVKQAEAVKVVSEGIKDISNVTTQNSATAEETAASCEELASQSNMLKDQVSKFKVNK